MNMQNELVLHKEFGFGKIISQADDSIVVEFFCQNVPIRFLYPACFEMDLRFAEAFAQKEIEYELSSPKAQIRHFEDEF